VRDLLLLAIVYASLPVIVFRPFAGLVVYSWLAYMRPQDMAWGITRVSPLSQWVAIAMVAGLVLTFGRERWVTFRLQTVLLVLLAGWISLSRIQALSPVKAEIVYGHYWKAILIALLTTGMVRSRNRYRYLMMLIAFSIGFLGAKRGLFGLLRGGVRFHDGPGGFMNDNNSFALALNVVLPLLVGLAIVAKERWVKVLAGTMAGLSVLSILYTFSRGGLVTLCVVAPLLVWRSPRRKTILAVLAVGVAAFFLFTSDQITSDYANRTTTIAEYEEDGSAMGRLNAWVTSWRVALDYPVFGVGPNNLEVVFSRYSPQADRFRVSHNVFFQLVAECGFPAVLLFLAAVGVAFFRLRRLQAGTGDPWVETWARMLQISIIAFMTGSMFLNTAYNELIYHLVALSVSLELVAAQAAAEGALGAQAAGAGAEGGAEGPWWTRPRPARAPVPARPAAARQRVEA
jgi:probable O-glycosylation ligase (exosortase A-associated)